MSIKTRFDLRRWLFVLLAITLLGLSAELLLLDHRESLTQWIPFGVLAVGLGATLVVAVRASRLTIQLLRGVMVLFVATGLLGLYLHYRGNVAFELEMSPALQGWELFRKALSGATPTLAPGAMAQLGLLGLLFTYRHPVLDVPGAITDDGTGE